MTDRYKLEITCKNTSYFIHLLLEKNIKYLSLNIKENKIYLIVDNLNLSKVLSLKTSYKIEIINYYGKEKIKKIFKKEKYFLLGILIFISNIYFLSHIVFDIEVVHNDKYIRNLIKNNLYEFGLRKYKFEPSYEKLQKIKGLILKKNNNDIEWLEIEKVGTKYIVRAERRKKSKKEKDCPPRNIIASKDSMILTITSDKGEVIKKKKDYVKKGDVIISGLIRNKDKIVSKVCASGKVYGEVWYKVTSIYPSTYNEEVLTGNKKKDMELNIFNKKLSLKRKYENYKIKDKNILTSNLIPMSLNLSTYYETKILKRKYNLNNIERLALKDSNKKIKNKLSKDESILYKKVLKKTRKNSKIEIEIFFKVREDISDTESTENIDIEKENEKLNNRE